MSEQEKALFGLVLIAGAFIIGYTMGQKKAAEQKAADTVSEPDPMAWFAQYGGWR